MLQIASVAMTVRGGRIASLALAMTTQGGTDRFGRDDRTYYDVIANPEPVEG